MTSTHLATAPRRRRPRPRHPPLRRPPAPRRRRRAGRAAPAVGARGRAAAEPLHQPRRPAAVRGHRLDDRAARLGPAACRSRKAVLVVSAHWESAPLSITSTQPTELVYDFGGFDPLYYRMRYDTPDAGELARQVVGVLPQGEPVHEHRRRGLDHGAWVPLKVMYPAADVPVLQLSIPTHDSTRLLALGERLRALREEGVLVVGSGFMTHGLPYVDWHRARRSVPGWSSEFDAWAADALARGDVEELAHFRTRAPGHAVRPPDGRALHAAVRHPRRGDRPVGAGHDDGRRLLHGPGEALVRGRVSEAEPRWLDEAEMQAWLRLLRVVMLLPGALDRQLRQDAGLPTPRTWCWPA